MIRKYFFGEKSSCFTMFNEKYFLSINNILLRIFLFIILIWYYFKL